jgi:transcriptional regulator with XRE-family HTH domain
MKIVGQLSDEAILHELGGRLAAARLQRNQTQAVLADVAGVSKRTVERLESGEVGARLSGLIRVLRALRMTERLDALIPPPNASPVDQLKLAGRQRQRASGRRSPARSRARKWTWGDES